MCKHNHCALWSLCLFVMANFFLACALLSSFQLSLAGPVFVSGKAAHGVLRRNKRENRGVFEELLEGNLERECVEEICDFEEAREIFENTEKTVEFWNAYMDGDQCKLKPCLHKATCNDGIGSYTCKCRNGFSGVNCEIDLQKRCDLNNGDCGHFCESMGHAGGKCYCAEGYKLMQDGISCEPEVEFACGRTALMRTARSLVPTSNTTWPQTLTRIVGGDFVTPAEIPWQAALVDSKSGAVFCGGSILGEQWVITAAHCLAESLGPFYVRANTTLKSKRTQSRISKSPSSTCSRCTMPARAAHLHRAPGLHRSLGEERLTRHGQRLGQNALPRTPVQHVKKGGGSLHEPDRVQVHQQRQDHARHVLRRILRRVQRRVPGRQRGSSLQQAPQHVVPDGHRELGGRVCKGWQIRGVHPRVYLLQMDP
ncbi:coagulation factor IXa isoform X2 [Phyllopteryx taeniolatus]|uniref:coagulation factor IXa isoform X2 n=1 Tax=Phyllopteryx taeniolatus TaxID=161469 RepID=UPI002AD2982C|nr:coagulation factor IXa isoform X2 [Phyllopteryx taeniolatus]